MGDAKGALIGAGGDVEQGDVKLQLPGGFYPLLPALAPPPEPRAP